MSATGPCPFKIPPRTVAGCCDWRTFLDGFVDAWPRWFSEPPTHQQWMTARRDWKAGNTGWEAAHNAMNRVKDAQTKREHDTWAAANAVITRARARM